VLLKLIIVALVINVKYFKTNHLIQINNISYSNRNKTYL